MNRPARAKGKSLILEVQAIRALSGIPVGCRQTVEVDRLPKKLQWMCG
jgi:hypothetical protein